MFRLMDSQHGPGADGWRSSLGPGSMVIALAWAVEEPWSALLKVTLFLLVIVVVVPAAATSLRTLQRRAIQELQRYEGQSHSRPVELSRRVGVDIDDPGASS